MKIGIRICLVVIPSLMVCNSGAALTPSWSYEHPRVASGEFRVRSACMMPAEGKLSRLGMKGGEGMSKESDAWSATLQTVVENHLKQAGVQLLPADSAGDSGASTDEIRQVLLQLQEKYSSIAGKINKKPKDIGKSRFTLGDEAALLPCSAKADVLVFVEGEGRVLTGGKKTMGVLFGGPSASTAALILTMADAKSGEILAYVRMANAEKFLSDSEKAYGGALNKQFKKMRIGTTADAEKKGR